MVGSVLASLSSPCGRHRSEKYPWVRVSSERDLIMMVLSDSAMRVTERDLHGLGPSGRSLFCPWGAIPDAREVSRWIHHEGISCSKPGLAICRPCRTCGLAYSLGNKVDPDPQWTPYKFQIRQSPPRCGCPNTLRLFRQVTVMSLPTVRRRRPLTTLPMRTLWAGALDHHARDASQRGV